MQQPDQRWRWLGRQQTGAGQHQLPRATAGIKGYRQGAAAGNQLQPLPWRQLLPVAQGQQGGKGGMAAEGDFAAGGEPAQGPAALLLQQESRLRLVETAGNGLQGNIAQGLV